VNQSTLHRSRSLSLPCAASAAAALLLLGGSAGATTIVQPSDEALATQAATIVRAEVLSSRATTSGPLQTETTVRVTELVAGNAPEVLRFTLPGGVRENGPSLWLPGMPSFSAGDRLALFLTHRPNGGFVPWHLGVGIFRELQGDAGPVLVRELDDTRLLTRDGGEARDVARDRDRFLAWVKDLRAGAVRQADYAVAGPAHQPQANVFGFDGKLLRWGQFDRNQRVPFFVARRPQPGADDPYGAARRAMAAWNSEPSTPVRYQFAGRTDASAGLSAFDGVNAILFDAPPEQGIPPFDCATGGILAVGGPWFDARVSLPRGSFEYIPTIGADVVFNAGTGCVWDFFGDVLLDQTLAHELGHTLGLAHSCGDASTGPCEGRPAADDALMRAFVHLDDRGARLQIDDRRGIRFLYGRPPV
jgi:hypothetical protein